MVGASWLAQGKRLAGESKWRLPSTRNARVIGVPSRSLVRSPPRMAQSSLQSNWKASPARNEGTAPASLLLALPSRLPGTNERCDALSEPPYLAKCGI